MAMGSNVENELWNIFTYYTVHGNVLDPERMTPLSLYKLCRETSVLDRRAHGARAVTQQDVIVACTAEMRARVGHSAGHGGGAAAANSGAADATLGNLDVDDDGDNFFVPPTPRPKVRFRTIDETCTYCGGSKSACHQCPRSLSLE